MLTNIRVENWSLNQVYNWLEGLCDDEHWLKESIIKDSDLSGKNLLHLTPENLRELRVNCVSHQELILEAVEELRFYCHGLTQDTLQLLLLRLACQSRSLQHQLATVRRRILKEDTLPIKVVPSPHEPKNGETTKQRITLDTLSSVSAIVTVVKEITSRLNKTPFSRQDEYRSMRSLLLALSVELTSTAQRDQFVEKPNDIIERSSKALADYCDTIVHVTRDPLLIEPYHLETVVIRKGANENELGLVIKSATTSNRHYIAKILPLSPAKKTNKLNEGDEVLLFNQFIIGWSAKKVEKLLLACSKLREVVLIVIRTPVE